MTKDQIITAIKNLIEKFEGSKYSNWTIGITTDPETRKQAHLDPLFWVQWTADSLAVARAVETYFLNDFPVKESERMKGGTGGDMAANKTAFVYVF